MPPVYMVLKSELGLEVMLVAYLDDVYLHGPPVTAATTISAAPALYRKVGLRIGWGPAKSKLALPPEVDQETLQLPAEMIAAKKERKKVVTTPVKRRY